MPEQTPMSSQPNTTTQRYRKFKVGDLVRIREWDDMCREFKHDGAGIHVGEGFIREMRHLCGKIFRITHLAPSITTTIGVDPPLPEWDIDIGMVTHADLEPAPDTPPLGRFMYADPSL